MSQQVHRVESGFNDIFHLVRPHLHHELRKYMILRTLKKDLKDIIFGFGPLQDLLRAPTVTEIMVVSSSQIYVERDGIIERSGRRFISDKVTEAIIERIVAQVGRRIDKSQPLVDARLPDGSRVNAIIPPLAIKGPCLTVRKFPAQRLTMDDLLEMGSISRSAATFLRACVVARRNILVSGGTGTGKTTMLNVLSSFIPFKERIVTIEDTTELRLHQEHVVTLETKPPNIEGAGEYTIRDLVKNALRMRPDRVIVGECRGGEALDMIQAMNTGHDGSMTTVHANSAREVIERLEVLVLMAADLPMTSIHRQLASALDLIVHISRLPDGARAVTQISEVVRYDPDDKQIVILDIFNFRNGVSLRPTGYMPSFIDSLVEKDLLDVEFLYGRDGAAKMETTGNPILVSAGLPADGPAVGTLAWSAEARLVALAGPTWSATWPTSSAACGSPTRQPASLRRGLAGVDGGELPRLLARAGKPRVRRLDFGLPALRAVVLAAADGPAAAAEDRRPTGRRDGHAGQRRARRACRWPRRWTCWPRNAPARSTTSSARSWASTTWASRWSRRCRRPARGCGARTSPSLPRR